MVDGTGNGESTFWSRATLLTRRHKETDSVAVYMVTLQQQIAKTFLAKLSESKDVDKEKIDQLRKDGKKVKAEDLVRIFSLPTGGDLK
jgi:hypothetical protein